MKFTNYLKDIQHVAVYPLFSLVLFSIVFIAVLVAVFTADKQTMNDHARIPLK